MAGGATFSWGTKCFFWDITFREGGVLGHKRTFLGTQKTIFGMPNAFFGIQEENVDKNPRKHFLSSPLEDVRVLPHPIFSSILGRPIFQLFEALFWPKKRPKMLKYYPTKNFGHFLGRL